MPNAFAPFDYGQVVGNVEAIKGARTRNALAQQELDPNSPRNQMMQEQLTGARQGNVLAQQQDHRAQTTFDQQQRRANSEFAYEAFTVMSQNPEAVNYYGPKLKEMGIIPPDADWSNATPEETMSFAAKQSQALGQALGRAAEDKSFTLSPGETRFGPGGEEVASVAAAPEKQTATAQDYKIALQQGYKGSFLDYQKEIKKAGATNLNLGLTKGQEAVDRDYAKEFVDFKASGGYADIDKQIEQLSEVQNKLKSGQELTGPITGNVPDLILNVINPEARSARDAVEEVVQRNLRLVLGAQFTEKEGERLIARGYNPKLPEAENLKRVTRLMDQISQAAKAKKSAADYFSENGTLKGFTGKQWSMNDFDPDKSTVQSGGWTIEEM